MANDLNLCLFIGRLGADPETRFLPTGKAVTKIRIAVGKKWRDKQSGQMQETTEWVPVVLFNRLAEVAGEYLKKGSRVRINGEFRTRKWEGQDGQPRYTTEIVANDMQMLDGQGGAQHGRQVQSGPDYRGHPGSEPAGGQPQGPGPDDMDDDIPF